MSGRMTPYRGRIPIYARDEIKRCLKKTHKAVRELSGFEKIMTPVALENINVSRRRAADAWPLRAAVPPDPETGKYSQDNAYLTVGHK